MKIKFTLITVLIAATFCYAQNGINYKALIKDDLGDVIANNSIQIKFQILQSNTLINVYEETHNPTTDNYGIIIVNIGEGTVISGVFDDINWGGDEHFLNVKIDTSSGFVDMGTTEFKAVPYALNVTGLEALDEDNGIGWRLKDRDFDFYGNIGEDAVDLSIATIQGDTRGATGNNSLAMGKNTIASGGSSTAIGNFTTASGFNSTAIGSGVIASEYVSTAMGVNTMATGVVSTTMGSGTKASTDVSTAMGFETTASGDASTAIGAYTTASGIFSTALGRNTSATGGSSTAMGQFTTARSNAEMTFGLFNTDYTPNSTNTYNATDRLLVIGNGTSNSNKSNALTLLKNGDLGLGFDSPNVRLHVVSTTADDANVSNGNGSIVVGAITGENIAIDGDEIMARNNNGTSTLFLQNGGGDVWVGSSLVHSSDRRLKRDITELSYGLNEVLQLKPKSYYWKNRTQEHKSLGLIAQEVQPIIANVVKTGNDIDKTLSISYTELIPVLIKAIHEQQKIIEAQDFKLSIHDRDMKVLLSRIEEVELKIAN